MKTVKILYDYSPACRKDKTGIPFFVAELYKELTILDNVTVVKTSCISRFVPIKFWKLDRFVEKILYRNIYLPLKMKWGNYDVYIENNYMFIPFFKAKNTFVVTFVYDIGLVLFDEIQTEKQTKNWRKKLPLSIANSDLLLTLSEASKHDIEHYLSDISQGNKPVDFIYASSTTISTVLLSHIEVSEKFALPQEYFLFIGTLEPRKNPLRMVQAFHLFKQQTKSDIKLIFAGKKGWLYHDVLTFIKNNDLDDEVIFTGYISEIEKVYLLQQCKAFLFLSIYEGFGIPALEALRLNTPTLLSDIDVFRELFQESVLYADPHDISDIASKMQKILLCPPNIDINALKRFDWAKSAYKLTGIIDQYIACR